VSITSTWQYAFHPSTHIHSDNKHGSVNTLRKLWAHQLENSDLIPGRDRDFSLLHSIQISSWAHPASYPMGTGGSFPRVKLLRHEANHLPQSSADCKNARGYTSISLHEFVAQCLIKHRNNFMFYPDSNKSMGPAIYYKKLTIYIIPCRTKYCPQNFFSKICNLHFSLKLIQMHCVTHLKLFCGHVRWAQCSASSSLLSPQSLSPSQSQ
jgi:hypothetical protein